MSISNAADSNATEGSDYSLEASQNRYMLTRVGQQSLVFPLPWVSEIMLIERSQILNLPFYDRALLGLVHDNGNIVPLLSAHLLLTEAPGQSVRLGALKETLIAVRLSSAIDDELSGVGIVVDQVIGSAAYEEKAGQRLFQLSDIPDHLWQPR